ncbi:MAG: putative Mg chelatase [Rhodospirillaceae bacterium]|nr:MAG: putative Mg chelatase [Rhodospirillaceae bacterium]
MRAKPGEVSLAHHGALFLDELPEFQRNALEALRQPLESGLAVGGPGQWSCDLFGPDPVDCSHEPLPLRLSWRSLACNRMPLCVQDYQARLSGPLLDRINVHVEVSAVRPGDLSLPPPAEGLAVVATRPAI